MKKRYKYLIIFGLLFAFEAYLALHIDKIPPIGEPIQKWNSFLGIPLPQKLFWIELPEAVRGINKATVTWTWIVMGILVGGSWLVTRRLKYNPGRLQVAFELYVKGFDDLCRQTLGEKGRRFVPFIGTIFIFVLLSNWIGILPTFWRIHPLIGHFLHLPEWFQVEEPTRDLNTTLGLGIVCFMTAQICGIRQKGTKEYLKEFTQPFIFMLPLNLVGEMGKLISHSFRLFGNIMGGAVILIVGAGIIYQFIEPTIMGFFIAPFIVLPLGMSFFFGLFIGLVQAFVFAMLALTYISVLVAEE